MKPKFGIIYKITNLLNGKVYIGQTIQSLEHRFSQHKHKTSSSPIHLAIKKYGHKNFIIEELEKCSVGILDEREIFYIEQYKSYYKKFGYNISRGGQQCRLLPYKLSKEQIHEMFLLEQKGVSHTELGKLFHINRKTVSIILKREGLYIRRKPEKISNRKDYSEIIAFIINENPRMDDVVKKFNISRMSVYKIAKSINYRFLSYNERRNLGI